MENKLVSRQDFKHGQVASGLAIGHAAFDAVRFEQSTMSDVVLQREVIGLFLAQLAQTRQRLKRGALSAKNRKFMSHNLRGAAAAIGALQIEELAKSWETVNFDPPVLDALLQQAETAFLARCKAFIS